MKKIKIAIDGKEIEATITAEDAAKITEWPQVGDEAREQLKKFGWLVSCAPTLRLWCVGRGSRC